LPDDLIIELIRAYDLAKFFDSEIINILLFANDVA